MKSRVILEESVKELQERFKYSSDDIKISHILNKFSEIGNKVKYLNCGGCAVGAYSIVEYSKLLGIKAKVVYLFNGWSMGDYRKLSSNKNGSCSHALVVINDTLYDSNGEYEVGSNEDFGQTTLELEQDRVLESISYSKHWNHTFDRRDGRKKIQNILGIPIKITKYSWYNY